MREKTNVLLVDDDPMDQELYGDSLSRHECGVHSLRTAGSLREAIGSVETRRPDVIVLDLGLPDSSGISTFNSMQERSLGAPVVVLTGMSDEELAMEAIRSGAQDFIVKGRTHPDQFALTVQFAVERSRRNPADDHLTAICSYCKDIRDDEGEWLRLETFLHEKVQLKLTHGACPCCLERVLREFKLQRKPRAPRSPEHN